METRTVVFGGGCFWCTEATFRMLRGVISVTPGYAGGSTSNPTYEQVCTGTTGHTEVIRVEYDPGLIKFQDLLAVFFRVHDPTQVNQQGNDVGTQYRSIILYATDDQRQEIERAIRELEESKIFDDPIVTEVGPLQEFYEAEDYHHNYFQKNPDKAYCQAVINPKVQKLREKFAKLLK